MKKKAPKVTKTPVNTPTTSPSNAPKTTEVPTAKPTATATAEPQDTTPAMKEIFKGVIDNVGTCLTYNQTWNKRKEMQDASTMEFVDKHFNSFTLENEMKPDNMLNKKTTISVADAKAKGYKKGRFSFNVKGGRCEACSGDGIIKIEMHFLPDVYVPCEVCKGKRYNRETLEVKYKDKNIYDVLNMTVEEALTFFENVPSIKRKIQTLYDVGLSYIRLGQPSTELSGGEAQRIKLAAELSKRSTGKTIYILDEPTTGLHFADVQKLVEILRRLSDGGNTVVVIEHNLDVIKTADYIIDIGPEGGDGGGTVVAKGTPEEVAKNPASYTGRYVAKYLK